MLAREEQPEASVASLDLAEVTDRAVTRVRRRAAGVDFDVRLEPWAAEGDATGLERAITNLLDNAAKWSPPGGTITVRLASGVLTVDDQGPGISVADLPHVFERFWRSDESRSMPGSGLGLAIVQQVVDQHGGRIVVSEAPGGGTRMSLSIPGDRSSGRSLTLGRDSSVRRPTAAARPSSATRPTRRRGRSGP